MISEIKNWRTMPGGREKYGLYLASREWAVLREAVKSRSGGRCERCVVGPGQQVHHQTYERIYAERLDDLVHLCAPCHEFLSGKRDRDPILDTPVLLLGRPVERAYLAGKITGTTWRDQIATGGWSYENHSNLDLSDLSDDPFSWPVVGSCLPIPGGRSLALTGPYWMPVEMGGHGSVSYRGRPHAFGPTIWGCEEDNPGRDPFEDEPQAVPPLGTGRLAWSIGSAIRASCFVFAWIDSADCCGTLVEIGYANGVHVPVVVARPSGFDATEIWLAIRMASICLVSPSPGEAWTSLWSNPVFTRGFS